MGKGTLIRYVDKRFGTETLELIRRAGQIIDEYQAQGLTMTVRQLHYQFVRRGLMPNTKKTYDKIKSAVSDGRLAGLLSWTGIEDRTRNLMGLTNVSGPAEALQRAKESYSLDLWADQPWRPEVWIEKEALIGVIGSICQQLRVDFFACRGYNSQSEQWRAGQRFAGYVRDGQRPIIFHLGDHDPSGLDMTRDNRDRLTLFAGTPVTVARLALNMDQIDQYAPPPNPAKLEDSRAADYISQFGDESWELDALEPTVIRDLISTAVGQVRDEVRWSEALAREAADKDALSLMIEGMGTEDDLK